MSVVHWNGPARCQSNLWVAAGTRGEQRAGVRPRPCAVADDFIMSKWSTGSEDSDPEPRRIKAVEDGSRPRHGVGDKAPDEILLKGSNLIFQGIYPSLHRHKTIFTAVPALCFPATGLIIQLFVALMSSAKWFLSAPSEALGRISSDGSI